MGIWELSPSALQNFKVHFRPIRNWLFATHPVFILGGIFVRDHVNFFAIFTGNVRH